MLGQAAVWLAPVGVEWLLDVNGSGSPMSRIGGSFA